MVLTHSETSISCGLLLSAKDTGAGLQVWSKTPEKEVHAEHFKETAYRVILIRGDKTNIWHRVLHSPREQPARDILQHPALFIPCNAYPSPSA